MDGLDPNTILTPNFNTMEDTSTAQALALQTLQEIQENNYTNEDAILSLPRRRCARDRRDEAATLAQALFPNIETLTALIKYDNLVRTAKAHVREKRASHLLAAKKRNENLLMLQEPWAGQDLDPLDLNGPRGIPMPVEIGPEADFKPIFDFLGRGEDVNEILMGGDEDEDNYPRKTEELLWKTPCLEFPRGIIYSDGRLDLCKMVVGPTHIEALMTSLANNTHISQFLLGNNVISTTGAKSVARFIEAFPDRIETWYLAGAYITAPAFSVLVNAMVKSSRITNVWLKRNPLTPASVGDIARLVEGCVALRTLDLENTELGDTGLATLFGLLEGKEVALRNLYLNANGMGAEACKALARVLAHPTCRLESLFMASNPIGDAGIQYLAPAIAKSRTLNRLSFPSTGLTSRGVIQLVDAVREAGTVFSIDLGASQTTEVHLQRFNHIDDTAVPAIKNLIESSPQLRWLTLGRTSLSLPGLDQIRDSVTASTNLVYFKVHRVPSPAEKAAPFCPLAIHQTLFSNVKKFYPAYQYTNYADFEYGEECRFLRNTPDVRLIDSMYRTRDKRMNIDIDPVWPVGDETWKLVVEDAEQVVD